MVAGYDLPTRPPDGTRADAVLPLFARDKKAVAGVTLVLDGPVGVEPVTGIDDEVLVHAFERLMS